MEKSGEKFGGAFRGASRYDAERCCIGLEQLLTEIVNAFRGESRYDAERCRTRPRAASQRAKARQRSGGDEG